MRERECRVGIMGKDKEEEREGVTIWKEKDCHRKERRTRIGKGGK